MPTLETPKFPQGNKPYLSPNPNDPGFQPQDGGRSTPVIVGTQPKKQGDVDKSQGAEIAELKGDVSTLKSKVTTLEGKTYVDSFDGKKGAITTDGTLATSEGKVVGLTGQLPYLTAAPTAANADGIKIVALSAEPDTYYDGYLYLITE